MLQHMQKGMESIELVISKCVHDAFELIEGVVLKKEYILQAAKTLLGCENDSNYSHIKMLQQKLEWQDQVSQLQSMIIVNKKVGPLLTINI